MDLTGDWEYIRRVARRRLSHNKTPLHVDGNGDDLEILGAAGELAARRFLGLPEELHEGFDGGVDIFWQGLRIDVKATQMTNRLSHRYLQWPSWKPLRADIVLLTAVNLRWRRATVIGYATRQDLEAAQVNFSRDTPCREIPITRLRPAWELEVPPMARPFSPLPS